MGKYKNTIVENKVDTITSLIDSIYLSGGRVSWYEIKDKTVEELIDIMAPNGIRFHTKKE